MRVTYFRDEKKCLGRGEQAAMQSGTAWIYAAVSSGRQESTIPDQLAWGRATAEKNGWPVTREFHDVATGKDGTREILEDLLAELKLTPKKERPERVLMIRLDRMGRGTGLDVIGAFGQIYKLGVVIHTRTDGDIPLDDPMQALRPIFDIWGAAKDNSDRRDKSRSMHARKKAAGEVQGPVPYGFAVEKSRAVPIEPEASFVRELFEKRATGWGILRLAKYARTHAPGKPRKWPGSSIRTVLANQRYRGTIVPEDLFDEVRSIYGERPPSNVGPFLWPLRGAVRCVCGLRLVTRPSGHPGRYKRYYFCYNVGLHGSYIGHRAEALEAQFLELIRRLESDPSIISPDEVPAADTEMKLRGLHAKRGDLTKQRERIWDLFNRDLVPEAELGKRLSQIAEEEKQLDEMQTDLERAARVAAVRRRRILSIQEEMHGLAQGWIDASAEIQQQIARTVAEMVEGLWVDPTTPHTLYFGQR